MRIPKRLVWLLPVIFCLTPPLHSNTDWGGSHNFLYQYTLSQRWYLLHRSLLSTRNDFGDAFFGMGDLSVGYKLDEAFAVRVGYRLAWLKQGGDWKEERRPSVELRHFRSWKGYAISNLSRLEFRLYDHQDNDVRFRHEIRIEGPWRFTPLGLRPYLEEEIFYSFDDGRMEGNWLSIGLSYKPTDNIKLKLGYRWLAQRIGDDWLYRNVVVTGIMLYY